MWKTKIRPRLAKYRGPLWLVAIMLAAWFLLFGYKYQFIYNNGTSMIPTHIDGEWLVMQKIDRDWIPQRYDLVAIYDDKENELLTKRVIGLPNEHIEIKEGEIFLNDKKLDDPFGDGELISYILVDEDDNELHYWGTTDTVTTNVNEAKIRIEEGHVWVIGDNRDVSHYGLYRIKNIRGKIVL
jgi:signal peptidase I